MKKISIIILAVLIGGLLTISCNSGKKEKKTETDTTQMSEIEKKAAQFVPVKLTYDVSSFSENEKEMLRLFIEAAKIMDEIFWVQNFGDKEKLLSGIEDEATLKYVKINYGPWAALENFKPFVEGYGEKPAGANFYPADMTKEEFEAWENDSKTSLYTMIRKDETGALKAIPYSEFFKEQHEKAAVLLEKAAALTENQAMKKYLNLRAKALLTDEYFESDMAWMDMKDAKFDLVIGPIENYTDALYGYKAAHEAFILIKDEDWSEKLSHFSALLPQLQQAIPVEEKYKKEKPGLESDINVYDAIYYAGDCNSGSKTIAINLPNDEKVQLKKGTRKLQLKNSMKAKFDHILVPISTVVIAEDQRKHIKFDAFFENTMFHEVAHGMGIKNTINNKGTVREALKESYTSIEEGKADILGLYLVTKLYEMGELNSGEIMDNYVTFFAGIFRSSRFGAASAHGKANMMRFNYFAENEAFTKNKNGTYTINFDKMKEATTNLVEKIIIMQGEGDYEGATDWIKKDGVVKEQFQKDLDRINDANIPVDIVFEQGADVLGL